MNKVKLTLFLFLSSFLYLSCTSNDDEVKEEIRDFNVDKTEISFGNETQSQNIQVTASTNSTWKLDAISSSWLTATPLQGTGSQEIKFTVRENTSNAPRNTILVIRSSEKEKIQIKVVQEGGANQAPGKSELTAPANQETGTSPFPTFKWKAVSDPDKDRVTYRVSYSTDQTNWITLAEELVTTTYICETDLGQAKVCYWKVTASDPYGASTDSNVFSFTTGNQKTYADGEAWKYTGDPEMNGPIPLIFTGDGYLPSHFVEGGLFERKANEGIEYYFSVEPYKSLKKHFTVYKMAAYSKEAGISTCDQDPNKPLKKVNTVFSTLYYGNGYNSTYMTTNDNKVYQYAKAALGITEADLNKTGVVLIANSTTYSGTCWCSWDGRSVAIVPTCDDRQPYSYRMTMVHEAGGHGFGMLADEYRFDDNPINQEQKNGLLNWRTAGYNTNIDLTGDLQQIIWKHFIGVSGYENVGAYPGAQYASGVWMPESTSAMRTMLDVWYNAPSRETIVKRIFKNIGETYTFEKFKEIDKVYLKEYRNAPTPATRSSLTPALKTAHTPPQYH